MSTLTDKDRDNFENGLFIKPAFSTRKKNPTFPELVWHYLGEKEARRPDPVPLGCDNPANYGRLGSRHHVLLRKVKRCSKRKLDQAWAEWHFLGCHSKGAAQQNQLWINAAHWMACRDLYLELEKGLTGDPAEQEELTEKWELQALFEIKDCTDENGRKTAQARKDWSFMTFEDLRVAVDLDVRDPQAAFLKLHPDSTLGKQFCGFLEDMVR